MDLVHSWRREDFRAHGQSIFGKVLCDGSETENLVIGDLDKILNEFNDDRKKVCNLIKIIKFNS